MPDPETRRRRILFRATHRGTYENDILIGSFVRTHLDRFTEAELDEIERVMEHPEPVLADWLMRRVPIPPDADCPMLRDMLHAAHNPASFSLSRRERAGVRAVQQEEPSPNPLPEGEGPGARGS